MAEQKPDEPMMLLFHKCTSYLWLHETQSYVRSGDDLKRCQEVSQINPSARRFPGIQGDLGLEQHSSEIEVEETTVRRN